MPWEHPFNKSNDKSLSEPEEVTNHRENAAKLLGISLKLSIQDQGIRNS